MANSKGSQSVRSFMYPGKNALLPPKIPFPSVSSASYSEYIPSSLVGSRYGQKLTDEKTHHQRTSSESHLVEEFPFWLDDLLNEPDSPARKCGHRRSSSDSYAYLDVANATNISLTLQNDFSYRNTVSSTQRGIQELERNKNAQDAAFYSDANYLKPKTRQKDSLVAPGARPSWLPFTRESAGGKNMGSSYISQDTTIIPERKNYTEPLSHDPKLFSSEENNSNPQPVTYEADNTKRAKQQFAQRSRVRKLQYISELERNVQILQAEGSKVSAELDFLNQRNLILSMENKALKQRLETIAQEKRIKQLEQDLLEKEIGRLRALYQQQQQQTHKPSASLGRTNSKDLESQFSSLSLKGKDSNCRRDSVSVMSQFHF